MPCYEVRSMSVEFKADHFDLLEKAAAALKWSLRKVGNGVYVTTTDYQTFTIDLQSQRAEIPDGMQGRLNELKRAYSNEALKKVTALKGWSIMRTSATKGVITKQY